MSTSQAPPSPPAESNTNTTKTKTNPVILDSHSIHSHEISSFPSPTQGHLTWRTLLSTPATPTSSMCAGIATCPPSGFLSRHRHKEAEIYYIISGRGTMEIDGEEFGLEKGGIVFVPGDAEHGVWNRPAGVREGEKKGKERDGEGEDLVWLYVFPTGGFGDVVYRFSEGKEGGGEY